MWALAKSNNFTKLVQVYSYLELHMGICVKPLRLDLVVENIVVAPVPLYIAKNSLFTVPYSHHKLSIWFRHNVAPYSRDHSIGRIWSNTHLRAFWPAHCHFDDLILWLTSVISAFFINSYSHFSSYYAHDIPSMALFICTLWNVYPIDIFCYLYVEFVFNTNRLEKKRTSIRRISQSQLNGFYALVEASPPFIRCTECEYIYICVDVLYVSI